MSWLSNLGNTVGSLFGRKSSSTTPASIKPKDPEAPLKGLINKASPNSFMGQNRKLKDALDGNFKKGGTVKKTGIYRLHKGEEVIPSDMMHEVKGRGYKYKTGLEAFKAMSSKKKSMARKMDK